MMTDLTPDKEFSRKSLLKGGALIVGFSLAGAAFAGGAKADYELGDGGRANNGVAPSLNSVDSWLTVNADNTVTVLGEKLEYGQGTTTGLRMIAV